MKNSLIKWFRLLIAFVLIYTSISCSSSDDSDQVNDEENIIQEAEFIQEAVLTSDRDILLKFFQDNPENTLGWDISESDIAKWRGLTLDENGNVVGLDFKDSNISVIYLTCILFF